MVSAEELASILKERVPAEEVVCRFVVVDSFVDRVVVLDCRGSV